MPKDFVKQKDFEMLMHWLILKHLAIEMLKEIRKH